MIDTASDRAALQPFLLTGERLLWVGRPPGGVAVTGRGIFTFVFGLLFFGFACFWTFASFILAEDIWFSLFGIPFILVGLHLVLLRPILSFFRRRQTVYGVTNQRILRLVGSHLSSMSLEGLPPLTMDERADRRGTIYFGAPLLVRRRDADGREHLHQLAAPGTIASFDNIDNARAAYEIIRKEVQRTRQDRAA